MVNNAYIFIGRSGCGKGTQAKLLEKYLQSKGQKVVYVGTGQAFRDFIGGEGNSQKISRAVMNQGVRQPEFLAIWVWTSELIEKLQGGEEVIFDGTPRSLLEARVLTTALSFYGLVPHAIHLDISHDEAIKRLLLRGREDDKEKEDREERLRWFQEDVIPAIEYYKNEKTYNLLTIDGVGSVEEIQNSLRKSLRV